MKLIGHFQKKSHTQIALFVTGSSLQGREKVQFLYQQMTNKFLGLFPDFLEMVEAIHVDEPKPGYVLILNNKYNSDFIRFQSWIDGFCCGKMWK